MRISIIGTGYVGLVTGTCLAETGNRVVCMDVDEKKISSLEKGLSPIFEPGLQELITRNFKEKRLSFTTKIRVAVQSSSVIFLALPTPPQENGSADLEHIMKVSEEIASLIEEPKTVVIKSTVPVGTNERVRQIFEKHSEIPVAVVSNPEFQKQGAAVQDFMSPDRVVVGTSDRAAEEVMREIYSPFMRHSDRFIIMDEKSAEMTKYAANSFLAIKISFMNEISRLCDTVGADVELVRRGIAADPRIGRQFLFPGVGYGGSCFPKDVKALIKTGDEHGVRMPVTLAASEVNETQKEFFVDKIKGHFSGQLQKKMFAVWGLSYKPKTDDMREAPAAAIIWALLREGADVVAYDPVAGKNARRIFKEKVDGAKAEEKHSLGRFRLAEKPYEALKGADALVLITEWQEFREPDYDRMKTLMRGRVVFDGRNVYSPSRLQAAGFQYYGIGRK